MSALKAAAGRIPNMSGMRAKSDIWWWTGNVTEVPEAVIAESTSSGTSLRTNGLRVVFSACVGGLVCFPLYRSLIFDPGVSKSVEKTLEAGLVMVWEPLTKVV